MAYTLIIGAGPAGLAMAGRLSVAGMPFDLLEQGNQIAPSWQNHYRRLHLHTVKKYSNLPHQKLPEHYPQYVPRAQLVEYYERYAAEMGIQPRFGEPAGRVWSEEGKWRVKTPVQDYTADQVVVATGFNRRPVVPEWPGQERFGAEILHSRQYLTGAPYKGKRVLVVGFGNTGAEIALDLLEQGAKPALSVRSPVNIVPRDFLGNATQKSAMILSRFPPVVGDAIGSFVQRIAIGDLSRYGLRKAAHAPAWQQRTTGKTPVMDIGTVKAIKRGDILVYPGVQAFDRGLVRFEDGREQPFDAVVLATGYQSAIDDFVEDAEPLLNEHGIPAALWFAGRPGLYFLGFDAYSNGLLWSIREDSGKILKHMQNAAIGHVSARESPTEAVESSRTVASRT